MAKRARMKEPDNTPSIVAEFIFDCIKQCEDDGYIELEENARANGEHFIEPSDMSVMQNKIVLDYGLEKYTITVKRAY